MVVMRAQKTVLKMECYSVESLALRKVGSKWMDLDSAEQKVRMR
jgi:hypothetical protein